MKIISNGITCHKCPFSVKVTRNGLLSHGPKQMSNLLFAIKLALMRARCRNPSIYYPRLYYCDCVPSRILRSTDKLVLLRIISLRKVRRDCKEGHFSNNRKGLRKETLNQTQKVSRRKVDWLVLSFVFRWIVGKNALRLVSKYLAFLYFSYSTLTTQLNNREININ